MNLEKVEDEKGHAEVVVRDNLEVRDVTVAIYVIAVVSQKDIGQSHSLNVTDTTIYEPVTDGHDIYVIYVSRISTILPNNVNEISLENETAVLRA